MHHNQGILNVFKPIGKTSLQMINILRDKFPEYANQKISFAGRLDPMAQGVLILLVGDAENEQRREREKSEKEYDFTMIFGISTDTYDICGIPTLSNKKTSEDAIREKVNHFVGTIDQKLPKYSAYIVRGKPMYVWAAKDELKDEEIPRINREIFSINIIDFYTLNGQQLLEDITKRIGKISKGDFRQERILPQYKYLLNSKQSFLLMRAHAHVSSGTYIRSLCNDLGESLECMGISLEITRTRSGIYKLEDSIRL